MSLERFKHLLRSGHKIAVSPPGDPQAATPRRLIKASGELTRIYETQDEVDETTAAERELLDQLIMPAWTKITNFGHNLETKDRDRWQALAVDLARYNQHKNSLGSSWDDLFKPGEEFRVIDVNFHRLAHVAIQVDIHNTIDRMRVFSRKVAPDNQLTDVFDLFDFYYAGDLTQPIPEFSLLDLFSGRLEKLNGLAAVFSYLADTSMIPISDETEKAMPKEQSKFAIQFPKYASGIIHEAIETIHDLTTNNLNSLKSVGASHAQLNESIRVVMPRVNSILDQLIASQTKMLSAVVDTHNRNNQSMCTELSRYLSGDKISMIHGLFVLGVGLRDINLYKKAKTYADLGVNPDFNSLFANALRTYVEEACLTFEPLHLTKDDLPAILNEGVEDTDFTNPTVPSFQDMGKIISSIFSKTSKIGLVPLEVDWGPLIQPATVRFIHDIYNPHTFQVELSWENDLGELTELTMYFNTKKNMFDWSFIDPPTSPEMAGMQAICFVVTEKILQGLNHGVAARRETAISTEIAKAEAKDRPAQKRERFDDEIYQLRKDVKSQQRQAQTASTAQDNIPAAPETTQIRKLILVPDGKIPQGFLTSLNAPDRETILQGIRDFNERGVGEFKRKRMRGREGDILYGLRVNCSAPKGARVLVREVESKQTGSRSFEIVDIRYRKDIYKQAGI